MRTRTAPRPIAAAEASRVGLDGAAATVLSAGVVGARGEVGVAAAALAALADAAAAALASVDTSRSTRPSARRTSAPLNRPRTDSHSPCRAQSSSVCVRVRAPTPTTGAAVP
jgi:hypothetical protein